MIYICIPAHNEAKTIGVVLWKIRKVMAEFGRDYEVWVLDDASTDGTLESLERYKNQLPLRLSSLRERLGYPAAMDFLLRECVRRAPYPKRDAIVTLQGDFTEDPTHIVPLVKRLEGGADLVAGVCGSNDQRKPPLGVRLLRRLAPVVLGKVHAGAPVSDPLSGYRAYRVIVLKKAIRELGKTPLLESSGLAGNLELLRSVVGHARRIEEVPLEVRYDRRRRDSRVRPLKALRSLFRLRKIRSWGKTGEAEA